MLDLMNNARLGVAAQAIGIAEGAYREAREYAGQRVQFGAPIIEQPLVKSMLTLMAIHVQAARALLYRTCALARPDAGAWATTSRPTRRRGPAARRAGSRARAQYPRWSASSRRCASTTRPSSATRWRGAASRCTAASATWPSRAPASTSRDSIITTIYEGTSEIQASFALKEMSKGALFAALDAVSTELDLAGATRTRRWWIRCTHGIDWIHKSLSALMGDPRYALLNAKRLCEMVIDVLVAAELLAAGAALRREARARDELHPPPHARSSR